MSRYLRISYVLLIIIFAASFKKKTAPVPYKFPELVFFPKMPVSEINSVTVEGVELGRYLFYDPILSKNNNFSCASCHKQEAAFSDAPNAFSKGVNGDLLSRNTMPLFNLAWYPALFWDGKAASIEAQVFHPVRGNNEMNLEWEVAVERISSSNFYKYKFQQAFPNKLIDSTLITMAIAQFERTLLSYSSKYDKVLAGKAFFTKDEYDGFVLMNDMTKGDCLHCHTTDGDALTTTSTFSNNGLDTISIAKNYTDIGRGGITRIINDYGKFKIPSLRNIALTAPYMHDGRFKTLAAVLDFYSEGVNQCANIDSKMEFVHQKGAHLSKEEKHKIIAFLYTLTDSSFITDTRFSNPFKQ